MQSDMHDWTLVDISVKWKERIVEIGVVDEQSIRHLVAIRSYSRVLVPRREEWGPGVSINRLRVLDEGAARQVRVEMQTGDTIEVHGVDVEIR